MVWRHQQNASMNSSVNGGDGNSGNGGKLGGFFAYKNTFAKESVWVDVRL